MLPRQLKYKHTTHKSGFASAVDTMRESLSVWSYDYSWHKNQKLYNKAPACTLAQQQLSQHKSDMSSEKKKKNTQTDISKHTGSSKWRDEKVEGNDWMFCTTCEGTLTEQSSDHISAIHLKQQQRGQLW